MYTGMDEDGQEENISNEEIEPTGGYVDIGVSKESFYDYFSLNSWEKAF
jgi:hypothetical protein